MLLLLRLLSLLQKSKLHLDGISSEVGWNKLCGAQRGAAICEERDQKRRQGGNIGLTGIGLLESFPGGMFSILC